MYKLTDLINKPIAVRLMSETERSFFIDMCFLLKGEWFQSKQAYVSRWNGYSGMTCHTLKSLYGVQHIMCESESNYMKAGYEVVDLSDIEGA